MKITKTKVNFKDKRGEIRDILTHIDINGITWITCTKGSVRGNHYHKKTDQYDYIVSGSFMCYTKNMKDPKAKVTKKLLKAGDVAYHPAWEAHAFKALQKTVFISLTAGPRSGVDFEKDTVRLLEKPLVK
jgi:mannose-6-phosphate isomerase-like protein (cupin superfamily)